MFFHNVSSFRFRINGAVVKIKFFRHGYNSKAEKQFFLIP